ncbi:MAG: NAD(P)H-dependent oxidoreductase subunit E [Rhodospirillales bacterium]|nr:NAD(P)H-dependent oxidoreductase subunit E [Rhodospirillales bacterium]MDH3913596.1 NAD(P)H-dependent oxidoreductase subunit E [Rhodospirillales bacterium]MDH3917521.1 NAD(P)H-dependent oxidoreductase subunit E [Rhodospirillales bacterium]MDH3968247.1 NAD(P)H-dependent oxidoreductase subunit E [Rhodospirillales bacterium]
MSEVTSNGNGARRRIHPGSGRRRAPAFPKGRQLDPAALSAVRDLLGTRPRQRDFLIEYLHLIQDAEGFLKADRLQALAEEMRLPMAEVYEVASFYAHFDIVLDGEADPPPVTVRVCDSLSCEMAGARKLLEDLPGALGVGVRVVRAPCMGRCDRAPAVEVGHRHVEAATVEGVGRVVAGGDHHPEIPAYQDLEAYLADGGYTVLKDCLEGRRTVADVIEVLSDTGLRGLGGAGFPTGRKWSLVRAEPAPRLLAINADEGEPGTFKDRWHLESRPHNFLEGALIAAWAVEAEAIYIYLRDEYPAVREILLTEIAAVKAAGLAEDRFIYLRRGAGAYICGEESAMIESIEGKRGLPRHRPPYVAQLGLFGRPTLVNNVETLYWVPEILAKGADRFSGQGRNGGKGLRSFSVSGRVRDPGVKLAPAGITVKELIAEYCGGMAEGHVFKAYLPGGASGGILPAHLGDLPLDFGRLEEHGCLIGSHAVVILSETDDIKAAALNLMRFFEDESCGQCTPCRNGTEKAVKLMSEGAWDAALLEDLAEVMRDASICGLGQAAPNPLVSVLRFFPEDL